MPSQHEAYQRIEPISSSEPRKIEIGQSSEEGLSKTKFEEAIAKADPSKVERRGAVPVEEPVIAEMKKPSLMDVATKVTQEPTKVTPTPKGLAGEASDLRRQLERPRAVLIAEMEENPAVVQNLSAVDVSTMNGHLEHADRGLRDAVRITTGVEAGSSITPARSPAVRFLSFLTESDKKLNSFVDQLNGLHIGEKRLNPETLLAVHIKLGFIQTELEFFTATLNKALESTKTIMNIQI